MVWTILHGEDSFSLDVVNSEVTMTAPGNGYISLQAEFLAFQSADGVSASINITIAEISSISTTVLPYPKYIDGYDDPTILNRIHCTTAYQRAEVTAQAHLNIGLIADIPVEQTTFVPNTTNPAFFGQQGPNILSGREVGVLAIRTEFNSFQSQDTIITVTNDQVAITKFRHRTFEDNNGVFSKQVSTRAYMTIDVIVDDGTLYEDVLQIGWLRFVIRSNMAYQTDNLDAMFVAAAGYLQIRRSWHEIVTLAISSVCPDGSITSSSISNDFPIIANLAPSFLYGVDFDMASNTGFQFTPVEYRETFAVMCSINAKYSNILTFDMKVFYDPTVFNVVSCQGEAGWSGIGKNFDVIWDDTPGEILMSGYGGDDPDAEDNIGSVIDVASCTFAVISEDPLVSGFQIFVDEMRIRDLTEAEDVIAFLFTYFF